MIDKQENHSGWYTNKLDLNFIFTPDARFVYKRLISDARIRKCQKGQIENEVEEHWELKIP